MDNITSIHVGNVYYNDIYRMDKKKISQVCLVIKEIDADVNAIPVYNRIKYRYALIDEDNTTYDTTDFVLRLHGIKITPLLLEAIGFYKSTDVLPGVDAKNHYDYYMNGSMLDNAIRLIEENGIYKLIKIKNDGSFTYLRIEKRLRFIHELQDIVRDIYHTNLKIDIIQINHFFLFEQEIECHLATIVKCLKVTGVRQLDKLQQIRINSSRPYTMQEIRLLVNYGFRAGVFVDPYIADNALVELA